MKQTLLLVSDNQALFNELCKICEVAGYKTLTANHGNDALHIMNIRNIDAVICNAAIPGIDGYHLCYKIRRNPKFNSKPVIICSREDNPTAAQMARDMGADVFIGNTTNPATIVNHITNIFKEPAACQYRITPSVMSTEAMHRFNEQLVQRLELRNNELLNTADKLEATIKILNEAQQIAHIGSWELILETFTNNWTEEMYRIFGLSPEEIKPSIEAFLSFIHPDDLDRVRNVIEVGLSDFKPVDFTCNIIRNDGQIRQICTCASFSYDENGKALRAYGITHDITEKLLAERQVYELNATLEEKVKQRTEALVDANVQLESFAYSVSHDLRAPLRSIAGFTQILQKRNSSQLDQDGNELLQTISNSVAKMQELITDLLAFSRLGKTGIDPINVDLNALVKSNWTNLISSIDRVPEIRINTLPHVLGDKAMLAQVIINYLTNAIKYSSHNTCPEIEIGALKEKDETIVYVKDNGAGFDMANYDKLFGVFQRLHSSSEFEGTGVGLAIVKRVVEKHNGRVWAESEVGKGATFYFSLPNRPLS